MKRIVLFFFLLTFVDISIAQIASIDSSKYPKPVNFTAQQNQDNMMQQLGIKILRPGQAEINPRRIMQTMIQPKQTLARNYLIFLPQKMERK